MAEMSPQLKWVKTSGLITPDKWGNLPGGEIFTSPFSVNGRLCAMAWWAITSAPSTAI